jgi:Na+/H+-dicarboxylate symporter
MRRFFGKLYVQVLIGVFAGVTLGFFAPHIASDFKPLGDIFIKLIKMVFAPIIFATVLLGIARMENMKELGRVGVRALIGPGKGMNIDATQLDTKSIGLGSIVSLGKLMRTMYITCFLFVALVLGGIARLSGFSLWTFIKYIKDELFTVLGTSSSESVVPQLMRKQAPS